MTAARLPIPGEDNGKWGDILNAFLMVDHNPDGTLRSDGVLSTKANTNDVVRNTGAEVIGGSKTFTAPPTVPTPTQNFHAATKAYVDSAAGSGGSPAPDASSSTKGIVQLTGDLGGTATSPTVPGLANKANTADLSTVATSGSYTDLNNRPTLSTVATSGAYTDLSGRPALSPVATSGAYGDLSGTPTLSTVAVTGVYADLTSKPTFSTVATTGAYGDLSGRPTLSTVAVSGDYDDLTGAPALSTVATSNSYDDLDDKPTIPDVSGLVANNDPRLTDNRSPSDNSVSTIKLQDSSVSEAKLNISNSPTNGHFIAWDGTDLAWQAQALAPVSSVAGHTGAVTLNKGDVGLGNVDNTTDANKPVSSATQTALDDKVGKGGDTLTGALTLPGNPTNPNHAATKAYVDSQSAGSQKLVIGTSAPTPSTGQQVLWLDTTGGNVTLNLVTGE